MSKIELKVNGRSHVLDVEPDTPLLYILRNDLDLRGPRFGCGLGQCGACKVIIKGAPIFPASRLFLQSKVKSRHSKDFLRAAGWTRSSRPGSMSRRRSADSVKTDRL